MAGSFVTSLAIFGWEERVSFEKNYILQFYQPDSSSLYVHGNLLENEFFAVGWRLKTVKYFEKCCWNCSLVWLCSPYTPYSIRRLFCCLHGWMSTICTHILHIHCTCRLFGQVLVSGLALINNTPSVTVSLILKWLQLSRYKIVRNLSYHGILFQYLQLNFVIGVALGASPGRLGLQWCVGGDRYLLTRPLAAP